MFRVFNLSFLKKILIYSPLVFISFLGVYFIVMTSWYVRYWVDDFCSAVFLRNNGFWGSQIAWYKSWTGRYSAVFFTNLLEAIGPWIVRILPILLFVGISFSFFFILKNFLLSVFVTILLLLNAPNIIQSFYWQTGSLNYTIEFIFLNLFILFLLKERKVNLLIPFLLLFVAGGFSEAFALACLPFLMGILVVVLILDKKHRKENLRFWFAGFLGIIVSLLVMIQSPGNVARGELVTKPDSFLFVLKSTLLSSRWYLVRMFSIDTFNYSLIIIFASVFLFFRRVRFDLKIGTLSAVTSILAGIISVVFVIFTGFYSMSILPPERTLFIAVSLFLYSFFVASLFVVGVLNKWLSKKVLEVFVWFFAILSIVFSLLIFPLFYSHWSKVLGEVREYALGWDVEVKNLPEIKNIKPVGELDSFTDNKGWVSSCIAGYYGFKELIIK